SLHPLQGSSTGGTSANPTQCLAHVGRRRRRTISPPPEATLHAVDVEQKDMSESPARGPFDLLAADLRAQRLGALRALHVVEYALAAPAPRRQRTWLHRVTVAIDALHAALFAQVPTVDNSIRLLDEIALCEPRYLPQIQQLHQELLNLTIAVASLREQVEPDPTIEINPADIRDRLSVVTRQFREHQAREADLVYEATGLELDEAEVVPQRER
ncbi:MAG TPA: hypothetical protein VF065_07270, partial [Ilumatobacter sp.]